MLQDKVAVVTGAGRGIGREIALLMASRGAKVVVNDLGAELDGEGADASPAAETVADIKRAGGEAVVNGDSVADPQGAKHIIEQAIDSFGRIDIVVNNAGILRDKIFHRMENADWEMVIGVHLMGSFYVSSAAAPHFRKQESGAYVHFTSTSGLIGNMGQANYSAAKLGIMGLSKSIALDMQKFNVRSNCVAPFAWSRMIGSIPVNSPEQQARVEKLRQMTPAKIAPMVAFLASDAAAKVNGQIFGVRNNEIFLFSQPRPLRSVQRSDGWTPETIAEHALPALEKSFYNLDVSADVFSLGSGLMPFTEASLKAYAIEEVEQVLTPEQCMLYSLSVGIGADPMDAGQLRYVLEKELCANPLMANVLAYPGFWMKGKDTGVDWKQVLHGEQYFEIHRPLPSTGTLVGRSRVIGINDRGKEKGAFVYTRREVFDRASSELLCSIEQTTVCRGDGGCGGKDAAPRAPHRLPERAPDVVSVLPISSQAALLYRLNGDRNPLHADPAVAAQVGYPRPILHGLCTLGIAGHAILREVCDYDASRLRSMAVRFTAPVFPGETLRTEIWNEDGGASFRASVIERDTLVLGNGWVAINS